MPFFHALTTKLDRMDSASVPVQVRPDVLSFPAYRQGRAPKKQGFKLSSNENPFPPVAPVAAAARSCDGFNRYAAADLTELRTRIGEKFGVSADWVHLGAGSVSILYQLVQACAGPGENYIHPWPSFEAYPLLGIASGAKPIAVPLGGSAVHDLAAMAAAITPKTRAVLLCSPNNPTGPVITEGQFAEFMERVPSDTLVVLDEAYAEFVDREEAVDGAAVLQRYPNLVVLRTFAKAYGLAGLRIGYGLARPEIWQATRPTMIPMSVSLVAEAAALAALTPEAEAELAEQVAVLNRRRAQLVSELQRLGISVPEAQGNFVWIPETELPVTAQQFAESCAAEGILVRPFPGHGVRITVAEAESIPAVCGVVAAILGGENDGEQ